ncbi:MAG TPA: AAA family ATPase [Candidatus Choladousia intestinavium]|uniref:AAA family ATPase n=1 Tax=Candidatus Choladousia intestinavium TaxID=2840727 RepID=A0A9D1ADV2_9FIRM|nr:AAA family ATPase [Candidatus Choladousia intestinavium]
MKLNIPVGVSDFEKIRRDGYFYVDKTGLISELLNTQPAEVTLITRPRRFGKTLGMSMLANFFDIRKDSRNLFEGLEILECSEICRKWMNQWPTLFLTLKDVAGQDFAEAYAQLCIQFSDFCKAHAYLLECEAIDPDDKKIFLQLKEGRASQAQVSRGLSILLRLMETYYGKPVILLLDEYDVPVAKASSQGYYEEMMGVIAPMMSTALKDNSSLRFAIITGCLRIAKESIFSGANNFVINTISSTRLNEYFGFTRKEIEKILQDTGLEGYAERIREWYDGYCFGDLDVYCPWDVMNYVRELQSDLGAEPGSYWKNTSDNAVIRSFIDYAGSSISLKLEALMRGETIVQKVEEDLTYDYLHSSEDNLWSILYLTGYLTKEREKSGPQHLKRGESALKIPNAEIREIFESTIMKWFADVSKTWSRKELFKAVWKGDSEAVSQEMTKLLRRTISYHDYREDFYHAFLAGIFAGAGYTVESNREHGEGRSDLVVYDPVNARVAVFEAKYARTLEGLEASCDEALLQMDERMYAREFEEDYDWVFCYGIAFFKKRCKVKRKLETC